MTENCAKL